MIDEGSSAESPPDATSNDGPAESVRTTPDMVRRLLMGSPPTDEHQQAEIARRLALGAKW